MSRTTLRVLSPNASLASSAAVTGVLALAAVAASHAITPASAPASMAAAPPLTPPRAPAAAPTPPPAPAPTRPIDPPSPCAQAPVDPALRHLAVTLGAADPELGWQPTLVAADGASFPAVSEDGTTIVALFQDAQDFTGIPVSTVVFYRRGGAIASYDLSGDRASRDDDAAVIAAIDHRLARTRWRALPVGVACSDAAAVTLDGVTIAYDADRDRLTASIDGGAPRRLRVRVPALGDADHDVGGGACGHIQHLDAFGARALGFAIVVPSGTLGGDSCFGRLGVDTAFVVPLPR